VPSPLETLEGAILDGLAAGHRRRARFGDLLSRELRSMGEGGAGTATWGALATMWEILAPGWCQRRGARFRQSDGELDSGVATARGRRRAGRADRTGEDDKTGKKTVATEL
jgi:hypothetical protein